MESAQMNAGNIMNTPMSYHKPSHADIIEVGDSNDASPYVNVRYERCTAYPTNMYADVSRSTARLVA